MSPEIVTDSEPQPQGMSELGRLAGVIFEPGKAFKDIAARPRFVVPLVLAIVVGIAMIAMFSSRVGWERMARTQIMASSQAAQLTPEDRENRVALGAKFGAMIGYAAAVLGPVVFSLIVAGALTGIVAGILSAPVKFKQVFAIVCYSGVIRVIFVLLTMVVMTLKNPNDFDLKNPLMFNPGAFMDPAGPSKFLYSLASSLDLFSIWGMVVIAIGLKAAAGKKLSFGGALFAVFLPWALVVLCGASFAAMFS